MNNKIVKSTSILYRRKFIYLFTIFMGILLVINTIVMLLTHEYFTNYKNYDTMEIGFEYIESVVVSKIKYLTIVSTIYSKQISDVFTDMANDLEYEITPNSEVEVKFNLLTSRLLRNELDTLKFSAAFQVIRADFENGRTFNNKIVMANRESNGPGTQSLIYGPDYIGLERDEVQYSPYPLETEILTAFLEIGQIDLRDKDLSDYVIHFRGYDSLNRFRYAIYAAPIIYEGKVIGATGIMAEESFLTQNLKINLKGANNFFINNVYFVFAKYVDGEFILDDTSTIIDRNRNPDLRYKNIKLINDSKLKTYSQEKKIYYGFEKQIPVSSNNSYFSSPEWRMLMLFDNNAVSNILRSILILVLFLFISSFIYYLKLTRTVIKSMVGSESAGVKELSRLALMKDTKFLEIVNSDNGQLVILNKNNLVNSIQSLSQSEYRVFKLYYDGYTPKEVSEILFISINTVKAHNRKIYDKLGINSREELLDVIDKLNQQEHH